MQGCRIDMPLRRPIVPGEQCSLFGQECTSEFAEQGSAASRNRVEIDHESPGALPRHGAELIEIGAAGLEIVRVRLELLPGRIALPLQWFAKGRVDAHFHASLALSAATSGSW